MNQTYNAISQANGFYCVKSYNNCLIYTTPKNLTKIDFNSLNRADWHNFEIELTVVDDYKLFISSSHKEGFHKQHVNISLLGNFEIYKSEQV